MTTANTQALYVALELGQDKWHLAFATQAAEKPRFRAIPARDLGRPAKEIRKAKDRFGLPADAPVRTCYEAGRDGFWVHRALTARGIDNLVVDSSSIEVDWWHKRVAESPLPRIPIPVMPAPIPSAGGTAPTESASCPA